MVPTSTVSLLYWWRRYADGTFPDKLIILPTTVRHPPSLHTLRGIYTAVPYVHNYHVHVQVQVIIKVLGYGYASEAIYLDQGDSLELHPLPPHSPLLTHPSLPTLLSSHTDRLLDLQLPEGVFPGELGPSRQHRATGRAACSVQLRIQRYLTE